MQHLIKTLKTTEWSSHTLHPQYIHPQDALSRLCCSLYLISSFRDIYCCTHENTRKTIKKKRLRKGTWGERTRLERSDENWQKVLILVANGREIFFFFFFYCDDRKFLFLVIQSPIQFKCCFEGMSSHSAQSTEHRWQSPHQSDQGGF